MQGTRIFEDNYWNQHCYGSGVRMEQVGWSWSGVIKWGPELPAALHVRQPGRMWACLALRTALPLQRQPDAPGPCTRPQILRGEIAAPPELSVGCQLGFGSRCPLQ